MRNWIFMNIEHGHLLTYSEMIVEFLTEYDGGDPTNPIVGTNIISLLHGKREYILFPLYNQTWNV